MADVKLTTAAACRVAGIDRDRFNEHVAAGRFPCAPSTIPGRTRLFNAEDMIALRIFREEMDEGRDAISAGLIACAVANAARQHPEARTISFVQSYFDKMGGHAFPADQVPGAAEWDNVIFSGTDIRKVTTYRIGKMRELIAHYIEDERNTIGERD